MAITEGTTARNPKTNERIVYKDGSWQPIITNQTKKPQSFFDKAKDAARVAYELQSRYASPLHQAVGAGENLLTLGTGAIAQPIAGISGLVSGALSPSGSGVDTAATTIRNVQDAMTYQPRTDAGKQYEQNNPLKYIPQVANIVGEKTAETTKSPELGAGVNTAIQFAPALFSSFAGRTSTKAAKAAKTASALVDQQSVLKAQEYVKNNTSLNWDDLSSGFKEKISSMAKDSANLDALDPIALERQVRLDKLEIPYTRGQVTRKIPQIAIEESLSKTEAGAPLRSVLSKQDLRLHDLLSALRSKDAPTTNLGIGKAVQDQARAIEKSSKANYGNLYKEARETQPNATVSANPLFDLLNQKPHLASLGFMKSWLNKLDITKETNQVTLNALHDLRGDAKAIQRSGAGSDSFYAGEVANAIDSMMSEIPESATAWKKADTAFKEHKIKFEDQRGVNRLVEDSTRTDPKTAIEDTFDATVRRGTSDQLQQVKDLLNSSGEEGGLNAWNALRSGTIDFLKEKASGKRQIKNENNQLQFNEAFLDAFRELEADGKLDVLFSKQEAIQLRDIAEAAKDVRTKPNARVQNSETVSNLTRLFEKMADNTPGGAYFSGAMKALKKVKELGEEGRSVKKAQISPFDEMSGNIASKQKSNLFRERLAGQLKKYGYPSALASSENEKSNRLANLMKNISLSSNQKLAQ